MTQPIEKTDNSFDLVVLGAGPGGYTAAFRAADLGLRVALIERDPQLGGVCLNVGCIPSKALLHIAAMLDEAADGEALGLKFARPEIDLAQMRKWKNGIVQKLTQGLAGLAKRRKIEVLHGIGQFTAPHTLAVRNGDARREVNFKQAVIAVGSAPFNPPNLRHHHPRVMDSTTALQVDEIPQKLLIIGGGIIGLEMATVYHSLGSAVSIVELGDQLMPGADADLVRPLARKLKQSYENIWLNTKVTDLATADREVRAKFDGAAQAEMAFDKVLIAVGRAPNGGDIGADAAGVAVDARGFIKVDAQMRTNIPHIFAIGDVVGQPMLAHKAAHEGKVAAEVAAGLKSGFDARVIPSVAYTDPEVAWVGVTEMQAEREGIKYGKGVFPWAASGRALTQNAGDGATKLLFDAATGRLIGAGITGKHAGDLIGEAALAIEMQTEAEDIALTIHPHPTLIETLGFAAEMFTGAITDLYIPKKR